MDGGVLYLHDLAGQALKAANTEIARLNAENAELRQRLAEQTPDEGDQTDK